MSEAYRNSIDRASEERLLGTFGLSAADIRPVLQEVKPTRTALDMIQVRRIIADKETVPLGRLANLIHYAFLVDSEDGTFSPVPEEAGYIGSDPGKIKAWLDSETVGRVRNEDRVNTTLRDKWELKWLREESRDFENRYEWLHNATLIQRNLTSLFREGQFAEVAIRTILVETQPD